MLRCTMVRASRFADAVVISIMILFLGVASNGKAAGQDRGEEGDKEAVDPKAVFPDARDLPLKNWTGPVFRLSQAYPEFEPKAEDFPWKKFDYSTQYKEYIEAVLKYCLEGNVDNDWDVAKNSVRKWYHAPWMHWGRNGRDFVHGLTHERVSMPEELARTQTAMFQNWAVGMYNPPGGYTVGRVWRDPEAPDPGAARFPEGTVTIKLLFTQASPEQVPYLKGAKEWQAYIYETTVIPTNPLGKRNVQTLRLMQVDIAVRDSRASATTGWVFGTFVYNGTLPGKSPWDRLVPVGLTWGNDPTVTVDQVRRGVTLKETVINASGTVPFQHLGWAGRLNGPVDNPTSSCLSCHATAQWPVAAPLVPPRSVLPDSSEWMKWFKNVKSGDPFTEGAVSLDYSLQLAVGIQNFVEWQETVRTKGGAINSAGVQKAEFRDAEPHKNYRVTRSGEE